MNNQDEVRRLTDTYRQYHRQDRQNSHWSGHNPGNRAIIRERTGKLGALLQERGWLPLAGKKILEVGTGSGRELARLCQWGASGDLLVGVDLLEDRISEARINYPDIRFEVANAEQLEFPDGMFDLVVFFTVFSSIQASDMAQRVSGEADRVLRPGGAIIWYDFQYNNPWNVNVHGITRAAIRKLFPLYEMNLIRTTLLPPIARRLGWFTSVLYRPLAAVPFLRTHYLGLLRKPTNS